MNNIKRIYLVAVALGACAISFGQNLNPTVEVTNTYEGDPSSIQKPLMEMNVPDSLMRFDLDFNYEVFDNPYQAAYDFKPYLLNVTPDKDAWRGRTLYLKAGAGYSFHPQLDFVWSPKLNGGFQFSIYASHRSYFGKYNSIAPKTDSEGKTRLKSAGSSWSGHDALTTAGFDGRYSWNTGAFTFGLGYFGLSSKDTLTRQYYNAADFFLKLYSFNNDDSYFYYDVNVQGRIGKGSLKYKAAYSPYNVPEGKSEFTEDIFTVRGDVGPVINGSKFLLGFFVSNASYGDFLDGTNGLVAITPKYVFTKGRFNLNLGLRIEKFYGDDDDKNNGTLIPTKWHHGNMLNPDVHASFTAARQAVIYADLTGGTRMNTYSSMLERNHFFNFRYAGMQSYLTGETYYEPMLDNDDINYDFKIGIKGNIRSRFSYDVNFGGTDYDNLVMDEIYLYDGKYYPRYVSNAECSMLYANARLGFASSSFRVDGDFRFNHTEFSDDDVRGMKPASFTMDLRGSYDITSRIYGGLDIGYSTERKGADASSCGVPQWLDIGLFGGYQYSRKLGFWLESGNLFCQKIQRNPFYAEKGLWLTAGLTLNL